MRASRISISIISIAVVVALALLLFSDRQPSYMDEASNLEPDNTNFVENHHHLTPLCQVERTLTTNLKNY